MTQLEMVRLACNDAHLRGVPEMVFGLPKLRELYLPKLICWEADWKAAQARLRRVRIGYIYYEDGYVMTPPEKLALSLKRMSTQQRRS